MRINRLIIGFLTAVAFWSFPSTISSQNTTDNGSVLAAEKLSAKSDPAKLRARLTEINVQIKEEPSAKLYAAKANLLEWLKDTKGALESITQSIELAPSESKYFYYRSVIYRRLFLNKKALDDLNKTYALGDHGVDILIDKALVKACINDNAGALKDSIEAIKRGANTSGVWFAKGCAERSLGKLDDSVVSLTKSILLAPRSAEGYVERALTYKQLGRIKESALDFKKARELGWDGKV